LDEIWNCFVEKGGVDAGFNPPLQLQLDSPPSALVLVYYRTLFRQFPILSFTFIEVMLTAKEFSAAWAKIPN